MAAESAPKWALKVCARDHTQLVSKILGHIQGDDVPISQQSCTLQATPVLSSPCYVTVAGTVFHLAGGLLRR